MAKHPLQDFITSRVRVKILELFYQDVTGLYYVREITRAINEEINAVRRELARLTKVGVLKDEDRGNRRYYFLNQSYQFYPELRQMIAKTTGLGKELRKNKRKLGSVEYIMFSGRFVRRLAASQNHLDVLVIGDVVLAELAALIKDAEEELEREINYTVFTSEEFEFRKTRRDPFILDVLYGSRVMIEGDEAAFVARDTSALQ